MSPSTLMSPAVNSMTSVRRRPVKEDEEQRAITSSSDCVRHDSQESSDLIGTKACASDWTARGRSSASHGFEFARFIG
jgi:hypothetical protein